MARLIRIIIILFIFSGLLPGCGGSSGFPVSKIKNVILIVIDTLRADHLSFMGYDRETSPFLEELADKSVVFDNAYSPQAQTLPAFTSLFTGLHPLSHGVHKNGTYIQPENHSLVKDFRDAGFLTAGLPAARVLASRYGIARGFDWFADIEEEWQINAGKVIYKTGIILEGDQVSGQTYWEGPSQPLFLFVHFYDTHSPYAISGEYYEEFADTGYEGPVDGTTEVYRQFNNYEIELDETDLEYTSDLYDAEIRSLDDSFVTLFDLLDKMDLVDNSLIVITADHGENLGEHHHVTHHPPYEAGLHIPLMFHFPGDYGAGINIDELVELTDVMPTLLDIFDMEIPDGIDGMSLLSMIRGTVGDPEYDDGSLEGEPHLEERRFLFSIGYMDSLDETTSYSIFDGQYRLIKDIEWSETSVLYDISMDPDEENDIALNNPDLVGQFEEWIEMMVAGEKPPEPVQMDPETEEMLRSLGYIH